MLNMKKAYLFAVLAPLTILTGCLSYTAPLCKPEFQVKVPELYGKYKQTAGPMMTQPWTLERLLTGKPRFHKIDLLEKDGKQMVRFRFGKNRKKEIPVTFCKAPEFAHALNAQKRSGALIAEVKNNSTYRAFAVIVGENNDEFSLHPLSLSQFTNIGFDFDLIPGIVYNHAQGRDPMELWKVLHVDKDRTDEQFSWKLKKKYD